MSGVVAHCQYCDKPFKHKTSLSRHINQKRCPYLKSKKMSESKLVALTNEIIALKETVKELQAQIKQYQTQLAVADLPQGNVVIDQSVNYTTTNVTVNNIIVFGNEDLSKLDSKKIYQLLMQGASAYIPGAIKELHNNDDYPQYKNIMYDPKTNKILKCVGGDWVAEDGPAMAEILAQKVAGSNVVGPLGKFLPDQTALRTYTQKMSEVASYAGKVSETKKSCESIYKAIKQKTSIDE